MMYIYFSIEGFTGSAVYDGVFYVDPFEENVELVGAREIAE